MPLATQADLEKFLQIDITAEPDAAVTYLLDNASTIIESYCGRTFAQATGIVETHDGGGFLVFLTRPPVTTITTVVENGVTLTASQYLSYPDGRLVRRSGKFDYPWFNDRRTVVVTYTGGYATIPFDIRDTCVRIVARAFQAGAAFASAPVSASGVRSLTLAGSDSVTYADAISSSVSTAALQLTADDKTMLNPYRMIRVA